MARGRQAIFRPKTTERIQGVLSAAGSDAFERARGALASAVHLKASAVSDGDTVECLARAWMAVSAAEKVRILDVLRAEIDRTR